MFTWRFIYDICGSIKQFDLIEEEFCSMLFGFKMTASNSFAHNVLFITVLPYLFVYNKSCDLRHWS